MLIERGKKMFGIYMTNFRCMYSDTFKSLEDALAKAKDIGFECQIIEYKGRNKNVVKIVKTI